MKMSFLKQNFLRMFLSISAIAYFQLTTAQAATNVGYCVANQSCTIDITGHTPTAAWDFVHYTGIQFLQYTLNNTNYITLADQSTPANSLINIHLAPGATSGLLPAILYNVTCDIFTNFTSTPIYVSDPQGNPLGQPVLEIIHCMPGITTGETWRLQPYNTTTPFQTSMPMVRTL